MFRFFRSSFATQYIIIAITGLILWMPSFLHPIIMPAPEMEAPLYAVLYSLLKNSPHIQVLSGFLIMLISAFYCNYIFARNEVVPKNSSLAAFSFVIFSSWFPQALTLNPVSLSLLFLMIAFMAIYSSYSRTEWLDLTYTAGFFTGIATLIHPPSIIYLVFIWIATIISRSSGWRSFFSTLIGIITPFLFISVYYFWFDKLEMKASLYFDNFREIHIPFLTNDLLFFIPFFVLAFVLLLVMINSFGNVQEKTIEGRRKNAILYWFTFFTAFLFFFPGHPFKYTVIFVAVPLAGILSSYMLRIRKIRWQQILWIVFIMFALANNYFLLLS
ncbi:MAG: DUF6427 family protein [Bacteroidota bacterium]|nr:DUF6427 family protein [Bacteroidota bacterium]